MVGSGLSGGGGDQSRADKRENLLGANKSHNLGVIGVWPARPQTKERVNTLSWLPHLAVLKTTVE